MSTLEFYADPESDQIVCSQCGSFLKPQYAGLHHEFHNLLRQRMDSIAAAGWEEE